MILVLNAGSPQSKYIADIVDQEMDARIVPILDAKIEDFENIKGAVSYTHLTLPTTSRV